MKPNLFKPILFVLIVLLFAACDTSNPKKKKPKSSDQKDLFDSDWKFHLGDVENAQNPEFADTTWRKLDLPHDWSIEDLSGTNSPFDSTAIWGIDGAYLTGGTAWYRKLFKIPKSEKDKNWSLYFEGIYMNADIWLNGVHLGNHPYGYTGFELDITNFIKPGEKNLLAVQVKNEGRNSRWYSGSGIYRHVWLTVMPKLHLAPWGIYITTPRVTDKSAAINI